MIEKLTVNNVGSLSEFSLSAAAPWVLVFGENGSGKSTVAATLRSLANGDGQIIGERKTIGSTEAPQIDVVISGEKASFDDGSWSQSATNLLVFDQAYVNENIYSGDQFENEHRKAIYQLILGDTCHDLIQQLAETEETVKEHNREVSAGRSDLERMVPNDSDMSLEEFIEVAPIEDLESQISAQKSIIDSCQQQGDVWEEEDFDVINLPRLPKSVSETLGQSWDSISDGAEDRVKKHIEQHTDAANTNWIEQGLEYQKDDVCPLCGSSTTGNSLLEDYKTMFNEEYGNLKKSIQRLPSLIELHFGEGPGLKINDLSHEFQNAVKFWGKHIQLPEFNDSVFDSMRGELARCRETLERAVATKEKNPLEAVSLDDDAKIKESVVELVDDFNDKVAVANQRIEDFRNSNDESRLQDATAKLAKLKAVETRHDAKCIKLVETWQAADAKKAKLQDQRESIRDQIEERTEEIFATYGTLINATLDQFKAGFRLAPFDINNRTKPPSVQLGIEIREQQITLGDKTKKTTRAFRSTLSSGERTMLALALFLAKLQHEEDLGSKVIVLDDPITNLDEVRVATAAKVVAESCGPAAQLVVLSHDGRFLAAIDAVLPQDQVSRFQLKGNDDGTKLSPLDSFNGKL